MSERDPVAWQRAKVLMADALERPPSERDAFLRAQCPDPSLLAQIQAMLANADPLSGCLEPPRAALTAGTRLGPYTIGETLGAGGMGEIYRARDTKLNRDVAIKVLLPAVTHDPDRFARFRREAQLLAALNHPNIGAIYGLEESTAITALVLELVEGPTLDTIIARGPMPLDDALPIARQIVAALEAAHEQGIIHRDLKPANIKLRPDGTVKVLDFGLAKALDPAPASGVHAMNSPTLTAHATEAGVILGTAAYMAPEQARGRLVDKRADIWAFGVVMFEMLAGRRPFEGETVSDIIASLMKDEPPWPALPATTPAAMSDLLARCLDKNPGRRLRDIGEVRIALDGDLGATIEGTRDRSSRAQRAWMGATAVFATMAVVMAVLVWYRPASAPEVTQFIVSAPPNHTLSEGSGLMSLSPDGRHLAFFTQACGPSGSLLWIRALDSIEATPLPGTEKGRQAFWSPDGRSIGFTIGSTIMRIDIAGGPPRTLVEAKEGRAAWSTSDVILFTGRDGCLYQVPAGGGQARPVTSLDKGRQELVHSWPVFLPDGRRFVFLAVSAIQENRALYLGSLDAPGRTRLVNAFSSVEYSNGYLLYYSEGRLVAHKFDSKAGRMVGEAVPVADDLDFNPANGRAAVSASSNGTLVYRRATLLGMGNQLSWFDRAGAVVEPLDGKVALRFPRSPRLSPDGSQIALSQEEVQKNPDIWLIRGIDGARPVSSRFTFDSAADHSPVWSPDGRWVAFSSDRKGRGDLYRRAADGTGQDELLYESAESKTPTDWSQDGKTILFSVESVTNRSSVFALPLTGEAKPYPVVQSPFGGGMAVFSPDGHWIAYQSLESGGARVYVQAFPPTGGKSQLSPSNARAPRWSRDGKEIFYLSGEGRLMSVAVSTDGGRFQQALPVELFSPASAPGSFDVSPDGRRFLLPTKAADARDTPLTVVMNWMAAIRK